MRRAASLLTVALLAHTSIGAQQARFTADDMLNVVTASVQDISEDGRLRRVHRAPHAATTPQPTTIATAIRRSSRRRRFGSSSSTPRRAQRRLPLGDGSSTFARRRSRATASGSRFSSRRPRRPPRARHAVDVAARLDRPSAAPAAPVGDQDRRHHRRRPRRSTGLPDDSARRRLDADRRRATRKRPIASRTLTRGPDHRPLVEGSVSRMGRSEPRRIAGATSSRSTSRRGARHRAAPRAQDQRATRVSRDGVVRRRTRKTRPRRPTTTRSAAPRAGCWLLDARRG